MKILSIIGMLIAFVAVMSLLLAWPFMWIWNFAVVQAVDFANPIDYWVAYLLMVFCGAFIAGSISSNSKR